MRIVSSFMDDLYIKEGDYHALTFESTAMLSDFRQLLPSYFENKTQSECLYLKFLDDHGNVLRGKDFYFISLDCSIVNLKEERDTKNTLQKLLFYHLENNPSLLKEYVIFGEQINQFLSKIEISNNHLNIGFHPTEKTIENFIKSLNISIEYNESENVPNYIMREFLIASLLKLNHTNKEVVLFVSYPETDIGWNDLHKVAHFFQNLGITTITLTTNPHLLSAAAEERLFLIHENGFLYDIIDLKKELTAFGLVKEGDLSNVSKSLALHDFNQDYLLLSTEIKEFLLSNRV